MMSFKNLDELLLFAVMKEEESEQFYRWMSAKAGHEEMKAVFDEFALEEIAHKSKLMAVRDGKLPLLLAPTVQDLKIEDSLVDIRPTSDLTYREALIMAMKREKAAFKLYNRLAETVEDDNLRQAMLGLAQEEARHKLRFEIEFDDNIMTEN